MGILSRGGEAPGPRGVTQYAILTSAMAQLVLVLQIVEKMKRECEATSSECLQLQPPL